MTTYRRRQFLRPFLPVAGLLAGLTMAGFADESDTQRSAQSRKDAIQETLSQFNPLVGGWRGTGMVKRGSTRGAWRETGEFLWKFDKNTVGIEYRVDKGKHIRTGLLSWDPDSKKFTFDAVFADKSKREYVGEYKKDALVLESKPDKDDLVSRVTMRTLNEKRMLVLYETRRSTQTFYRRLGEVGYTREGTRLANTGSTGPECVVTGGAGTIRVSYKGKSYYVCCTGCRDAFNDDPEGILADYRARLEERKKKKQSESKSAS